MSHLREQLATAVADNLDQNLTKVDQTSPTKPGQTSPWQTRPNFTKVETKETNPSVRISDGDPCRTCARRERLAHCRCSRMPIRVALA